MDLIDRCIPKVNFHFKDSKPINDRVRISRIDHSHCYFYVTPNLLFLTTNVLPFRIFLSNLANAIEVNEPINTIAVPHAHHAY